MITLMIINDDIITFRTWSSALVIIIVPKAQLVISSHYNKFMMNLEDS